MPLYQDVQNRYGNLLEQERISKDERLVSLEFEAREAASATAFDVARVRADCSESLRRMEQETQDKLDSIEREKLKLFEEHRRALAEIEEAMDTERRETDRKVVELSAHVQFLCDERDNRIQQINTEREVQITDARRRCSDAGHMAADKCRETQAREQAAFASGRAAVREAEANRQSTVAAVERKCESSRIYADDVVLETQRRVADRMEQLIAEALTSRDLLLENRNRANSHLDFDINAKVSATEDERMRLHESLVDSRRQLFDAGRTALDVACRSSIEAEAHERERLSSSAVAERSANTTWQEVLLQPSYVQGLEDFAHKLRTGNFWNPFPRPVAIVSPQYAQRDVTVQCFDQASLQEPRDLLQTGVVAAAAEGVGISGQLAPSWGCLTGPRTDSELEKDQLP